MSGLFNRMVRAARLTSKQALGVVTEGADLVVQFFRKDWPWSWKKTSACVVAPAVLGVAALAFSPYCLPLLEHTSNGIARASFTSWVQSITYGAINIGTKGLSPGEALPVSHFRVINVVLDMVSYSIHRKDLTAPAVHTYLRFNFRYHKTLRSTVRQVLVNPPNRIVKFQTTLTFDSF
ncbi:hypothetical protein BKA70DRAFT_1301258 [Coprinopsis sp. MPI-PUGE-AT-0042]|nr:hypothetical protein BKA70DRAFT_1301258 [Coprinopsis sp. MPI-PUGE-AT-0042]